MTTIKPYIHFDFDGKRKIVDRQKSAKKDLYVS